VDPPAGVLGTGRFVGRRRFEADGHVLVVRRAGDRVAVGGGGDLVDAGAVGDPSAPPVGVGHAEAVGQGDLAAAHRGVLLGAYDDAAGRGHDRHPAAGVDSEVGEIGGVDPEGAVGGGLAPGGRAEGLGGVVGAALAGGGGGGVGG